MVVNCHVNPMYFRTQKQDSGAQSSRPLYWPFVITVLHGQADIFIGKVENTDVMHYTKKGLHSIIKVLLGETRAGGTCPGKVGTK